MTDRPKASDSTRVVETTKTTTTDVARRITAGRSTELPPQPAGDKTRSGETQADGIRTRPDDRSTTSLVDSLRPGATPADQARLPTAAERIAGRPPDAGSGQRIPSVPEGSGPAVDKPSWHPPPEIPQQAWNHIQGGEFNARDKPVGWHHRPDGDDPPGRQLTEPVNKHRDGTYDARNIKFTREDGTSATKPLSTFFPDDWSPDQLKSAVTEAWKDPSGRRGPGAEWSGTTGDGMLVRGYFDRATGVCRTAYPAH